MKMNLTLLKWLFAAGLPLLAVQGCGAGPDSIPSAKLLSRKEKAIQTIEKVKSEKQIGLVEYEVRKIVKAKERTGFFKLGQRSILCSCKAYLKAGIDLSGFNPMTDVQVDPDETMITLTLPKPTLLSLNMPVDSVEILYQKAVLCKEFMVTNVNMLLQQGETQIRESVPELGILGDAENNARLFFEPLFKHIGFTAVQVLFKDAETPKQ